MTSRSSLACIHRWSALAILSVGCATLPPTMPLEGASRDPAGTVSGRLYGVYGGDLADTPSGAAGGRVMAQLNEQVAVGGEAVYGRVPEKAGRFSVMYGGRTHLKFNPNTDHLALTLGFGVLRSQGTGGIGKEPVIVGATLWTADAGVRVSTGRESPLEPYMGLSVSVLGDLVSTGIDLRTFGVVTGSLGANYRPTPRLSIGADLGVFLSTFNSERFDGVPERPRFYPTLSVAYRFGEEQKEITPLPPPERIGTTNGLPDPPSPRR